jgi:hypothetical protein
MDQPTRDLLVVNSQLPPIINLGAQTPDTLQSTDLDRLWYTFYLLLTQEKDKSFYFPLRTYRQQGDGTILNNVSQVFTPRNTVILLVSCP